MPLFYRIAINCRHTRLAWAGAGERFMTLGLVNPGKKNPPCPPLEKGGKDCGFFKVPLR
jgi:hypothetical protein